MVDLLIVRDEYAVADVGLVARHFGMKAELLGLADMLRGHGERAKASTGLPV